MHIYILTNTVNTRNFSHHLSRFHDRLTSFLSKPKTGRMKESDLKARWQRTFEQLRKIQSVLNI